MIISLLHFTEVNSDIPQSRLRHSLCNNDVSKTQTQIVPSFVQQD